MNPDGAPSARSAGSDDTVHADLAIIGAGPAGLSCAAVAARRGLSVRLVGGYLVGGQLLNVATISGSGGTGAEVAESLTEQASASGSVLDTAEATSFTREAERWWIATTDGRIEARWVVLATGTTPRHDSVAGAAELAGRGVCDCAMCDGPLFAGAEVALVAGERWWASEAWLLGRIAASVTVFVTARDEVPASVMEDPRFKVVTGATGIRVTGAGRVEAVSWIGNDGARSLPVAAVFMARQRDTERTLLTAAGANLDNCGRVVVDARLRAGPPGLLAAGDVRSDSPETLAGALADGELAAACLG